jgi:apolipoprotein N-acyltransferase
MDVPEQAAHLRAYESLTVEATKHHPDLIVWPASSLPGGMQSSRLVSFTMRRIAGESGVPIMVGGAGGEKFRQERDGYLNYSNSEFLIAPTGGILGQYNKMHLLPFNEYLPLQGYFTWPSWITVLQKSFEPGKDYTLFEVGGARFGAPICWENVFAEHFRLFVKAGAHFMVSTTNEGFFGTSTAPYQTLAMNVFRAVENRVPVVRVSTTGISAFISRTGEIQDFVRDAEGRTVFVSGYLVRDIPLATERTWYTLYGDVFAYLLLGLCAISLVSSFWVDRRESLSAWSLKLRGTWREPS